MEGSRRLRRPQHRRHHPALRAAPAQVAVQRSDYRVLGRRGVVAQQCGGADQHTGDAEAALGGLLVLLPIAAFQPIGSWASTRLSRATFQRVTLVLVAASAVPLAHNVVSGG